MTKKFSKWDNISVEDRFWSKVDRRSNDECWNWLGTSHGQSGYGTLETGGKSRYAHRLAYSFVYGKIPPGLCVCHHCDNPSCCNPEHLFLGSHGDNIADKVKKGRQAKGLATNIAGSDNWNSKLSELDVLEIRRLYATGRIYQKTLAKMFCVNQQHISRIINKTRWAWL